MPPIAVALGIGLLFMWNANKGKSAGKKRTKARGGPASPKVYTAAQKAALKVKHRAI